jgi:hypothetical protein
VLIQPTHAPAHQSPTLKDDASTCQVDVVEGVDDGDDEHEHEVRVRVWVGYDSSAGALQGCAVRCTCLLTCEPAVCVCACAGGRGEHGHGHGRPQHERVGRGGWSVCCPRAFGVYMCVWFGVHAEGSECGVCITRR